MENDEFESGDSGPVWSNILAGAVIGLAVGGALALLFAPKPGTALRGDLGDAVDDLRDRAEKLIDDLQESAQEIVTRSKTVLDQTRENLVRSVEAGKDAYVQKKEELTSQLDS